MTLAVFCLQGQFLLTWPEQIGDIEIFQIIP